MVYVEIFKLWKWENIALLAEDGQNFPEYHTFLKDLFLSRSIQVVYDRKIPWQASFEEASKVRILSSYFANTMESHYNAGFGVYSRIYVRTDSTE